MKIKKAIKELTPVEQTIFFTYVECGTYAGTARKYKVSAPTAKKYLLGVIGKIKKLINQDTNDFEFVAD